MILLKYRDGTLWEDWRCRQGIPVALFLVGLILGMPSPRLEGKDSLVPQEMRVSEWEAEKKLAELLSYKPGKRGEALALYQALLQEMPNDEAMVRAVFRLYAELGKTEEASNLADRYPELAIQSVPWWILRADHSLEQGRYPEARQFLEEAKKRISGDAVLQAEIARRRMAWGDFNGVIQEMNDLLWRGEEAMEIGETLALALNAAGRRVEAETVLRRLIGRHPENIALRHLLVDVLSAAKRFDSAIREVEAILARSPDSKEAQLMKLRLLIDRGDWGAAESWLKNHRESALSDPDVFLAPVEIAWKRGRAEAAKRRLRELPANPEVAARRQFWYTVLEESKSFESRKDLILEETDQSDRDLPAAAERFAGHGAHRQAIALLEAAVKASPQSYRSRFQLAEYYGIAGYTDQSIALYDELLDVFPESSKLWVGRARVLSWAKRYEESLAAYAEIRNRYPEDPGILREMARVAGWAKSFDRAWEFYRKLFTPTLDQCLDLSGSEGSSESRDSEASPYYIYESINPKNAPELGDAVRGNGARVYSGYFMDAKTLYHLQKMAFLEYQSKRHIYLLKYQRAEDFLEELVELEPGNVEARFDLGQVRSALGLTREQDKAYRELLLIAPSHSRAGRALEISHARRRPALMGGLRYWNEEGSERLSGMRILTAETGGLVSLTGQSRVSTAIYSQWEKPRQEGFIRERAQGLKMEGEAVISRRLQGSAGFHFKEYEKDSLGERMMGHFGLQWNIEDRVLPRIRWSRQENISNGFARRDEILFNQWQLGFQVPVSRKFNFDMQATVEDFSDDNTMVTLQFLPEWKLTDHPRQLHLQANLEYKDTSRRTRFLFNGDGELEEIIHPYWTPDDFFRTQVSLLWRHDLANEQFRGNLDKYYELRGDANGGSDGNVGGGIQGGYYHDLNKFWRVEMLARFYRSREWDNEEFRISLRAHF